MYKIFYWEGRANKPNSPLMESRFPQQEVPFHLQELFHFETVDLLGHHTWPFRRHTSGPHSKMISSTNIKKKKKTEGRGEELQKTSLLCGRQTKSRQENERKNPKTYFISINRQQFLKLKPSS